jgi:hypothetical protein
MWFFNNYINNRRLIVPFSNVERNVVPGYQKLYWSKVVMDLCRSISVNNFLNVKICQTVLFLFFSTLRIFMHSLQIVLVCIAKLAL